MNLNLCLWIAVVGSFLCLGGSRSGVEKVHRDLNKLMTAQLPNFASMADDSRATLPANSNIDLMVFVILLIVGVILLFVAMTNQYTYGFTSPLDQSHLSP